MSLAQLLEEQPLSPGCKVCDIMRKLATEDVEEYNAAAKMLADWPAATTARAFTTEGYPVGEKAISRHREKGHLS